MTRESIAQRAATMLRTPGLSRAVQGNTVVITGLPLPEMRAKIDSVLSILKPEGEVEVHWEHEAGSLPLFRIHFSDPETTTHGE